MKKSIAFLNSVAAVLLECVALDSFSQSNFWQLTNFPPAGGVHDILFCNQSESFVATDSGVFRSTNNGVSWSRTDLQMRVEKIGINKTNRYLFAVAYDTTVLRRGVYRSTDSGQTWTQTNNGLPVDPTVFGIASTSDGQVFLAVHGQDVYRTTDNGESWFRSNLPNNYPFALAVDDQSNLIVACLPPLAVEGGIYRSTDRGANWTRTYLTACPIYSCAFGANGFSIALGGCGILRSTDDGITWTKLTNSFHLFPPAPIVINSRSNIYVGVNIGPDEGIYRSTDNGNTWTQINDGLGNNTNISALGVDSSGFVYTGAGSTLFRSRQSTITNVGEVGSEAPCTFTLEQNYPNPFNPTTTIRLAIPYSTDVSVKVFNLLGEEVSTIVSQRLDAGTYRYDWYANELASGVYFYRLHAGSFVETKKLLLLR